MKKLHRKLRTIAESLESYGCICDNCNCGCNEACSRSNDYASDFVDDYAEDSYSEDLRPIYINGK